MPWVRVPCGVWVTTLRAVFRLCGLSYVVTAFGVNQGFIRELAGIIRNHLVSIT